MRMLPYAEEELGDMLCHVMKNAEVFEEKICQIEDNSIADLW